MKETMKRKHTQAVFSSNGGKLSYLLTETPVKTQKNGWKLRPWPKATFNQDLIPLLALRSMEPILLPHPSILNQNPENWTATFLYCVNDACWGSKCTIHHHYHPHPICKFTQRFQLPENNRAGRWREGLEVTASSWEVSVPKARTILWQIEGSPSGHASWDRAPP